MANSSQLVLPTQTTPASKSRCTAVPVYGGRNPLRTREAAVVSTSSTQRTSFSATGMPQSGEASPGRCSSTRAAASACRSASSRVSDRYACTRESTAAMWAIASSSSTRGVVAPVRSSRASSRIVLPVELTVPYCPDHEIAAVDCSGVAQCELRAQRCSGHVFAQNVGQLADLRGLRHRRRIDLLQPGDVLEDHLELLADPLAFLAVQPEPGEGRHVRNVGGGERHAGIIPDPRYRPEMRLRRRGPTGRPSPA